MYDQIRIYFTSIKPLHALQFGLIMIKMLEDLPYVINNKQITVLTLFDFSKTFDLVAHDFSLEKLSYGLLRLKDCLLQILLVPETIPW